MVIFFRQNNAICITNSCNVLGPAKVFATRGKYKQCFLRVTANGVDECAPANLKVNADRTLEIEVIEVRSHN